MGQQAHNSARHSDNGAAMYSIYQILDLVLGIFWFLVIAHLVMSWLINFQVLNIRQPLVNQAWNGLQAILRPIYQPIRSLVQRLVPNLGGIDISPLVVMVVIMSLRIVLKNNVGAFY
jgi:YggT family protein